MGMKITELKPAGGFCAETAAAATLFGATFMGNPRLETHTINVQRTNPRPCVSRRRRSRR